MAAIAKTSQHTNPHPEVKNFAGWDILLIFTCFDRRTTVFSRTKTCDDEQWRRCGIAEWLAWRRSEFQAVWMAVVKTVAAGGIVRMYRRFFHWC